MSNTYQEAIENSNIVSKTDINGIITFVNDEFCKICGYTRDELLGQNHNIVRHPDALCSDFEELWKTILSKQSYKATVKNLYNLEATPAEGTTYRFAKEDKKRYENIIQAGSEDNIYYTNSSQLPVDFTDDPFEALSLQDELQCKYTGGTVLHLYMNEKLSSIDACRKFVKNTISNFKLPYITVTPLFSVCEKHGYLNGEHEFCPKCDEEILAKEKTNEQTRSA